VVLDVGHDRERVSLSLKWLQEDPWVPFGRTVLGKQVTGTVAKTGPFGVFGRVAERIEGLLHNNAIAEYCLRRPRAGGAIMVTITDINLARRRVSLTPVADAK